MAKASPTNKTLFHRDGHRFGDRAKRTSIGEGRRKRGSLKGTKRYRGQGRR